MAPETSLVEHVDPRTSWTCYLIAAGTVLSFGLSLSEPSASSGLGFFVRIVFWLADVAAALVLFELAQITLGRIALLGAFLFSIINLSCWTGLPSWSAS